MDKLDTWFNEPIKIKRARFYLISYSFAFPQSFFFLSSVDIEMKDVK